MAPRTAFDFSTLNYEALSPAQRTAVVQEIVRQAHADRAREIAVAVRTARRGISQAALILGQASASAAAALWRRHQERRRLRRAAAQLYAMDDRALRDIGLRRGEIEFAVSGMLDPTRRPRPGTRTRDCVEALRPKACPQPTQRLAA